MGARFENAGPLRGALRPPPDKSVSHRAALIAAMGDGVSKIEGYLDSADTRSTLAAVEALGAGIEGVHPGGIEPELRIRGVGLRGPAEAQIDVGNAGTLMRLLPGWLAGQEAGAWRLDGDASIRRRPVDRIVAPLRLMGADLACREERLPPLDVRGAPLRGIAYEMPIASAQVKSCLLFAGLLAEGETRVSEPLPSRDHSERMLAAAGAEVSREEGLVSIRPAQRLPSSEIAVPGDFSSAAFFLLAALIVPGSDVTLRGVGLNPTRTGLLAILERMGAELEVEPESERGGEPSGRVRVRSAELRGAEVGGADVPLAIDELPLVALAACFAEGETTIRDAAELRRKESDRIATVSAALTALGGGSRRARTGCGFAAERACGAAWWRPAATTGSRCSAPWPASPPAKGSRSRAWTRPPSAIRVSPPTWPRWPGPRRPGRSRRVDYEQISYERRGPAAVITIERLERMNAIGAQTHRELVDAWTRFREDDDALVGILTGAGERAFCAGGDLKSLADGEPVTPSSAEEIEAHNRGEADGILGPSRWTDLHKPTIAAVNGVAYAGGLEWVCWAHMAIADERASFGVTCRRWNIGLADGGDPAAAADRRLAAGDGADRHRAGDRQRRGAGDRPGQRGRPRRHLPRPRPGAGRDDRRAAPAGDPHRPGGRGAGLGAAAGGGATDRGRVLQPPAERARDPRGAAPLQRARPPGPRTGPAGRDPRPAARRGLSHVVIAIDGPAGAGKSSVARATAAALGFTYLDSGAMYRCVALAALERQARSTTPRRWPSWRDRCGSGWGRAG